VSGGRHARPSVALSPDVRRARVMTWVCLVVVTGGTAGASLLDQDANPLAQGLFATAAALEAMIALLWWRSDRRRGPR
jgi:mRNA-degrading endonuclease toxin of MazEF toxin-antitoxin module